MKNSEIILLNKVTSSINPEAEQILIQILREKPFTSRTIIMITHNLTTIEDCDIILVMEKGRTREKGRPSDLLQEANSNFSILKDIENHD